MATRNGKNSKTQTAKQDDFDDLDFNLDDLDFLDTDPIDPKSRDPVSTVAKETAKQTALSFLNKDNVQRTLRMVLPPSYGEIEDFAKDASRTIGESFDEATKSLKPSLSRIKTSTTKILADNKDKIPEGKLKQWLDRRLEEEARQNELRNYERQDENENRLNATLENIFAVEQDAAESREKRREKNEQIRDALDQNRHNDIQFYLNRMSMDTRRLANYQDNVNVKYQRKMLEIQLRRYNLDLKSYAENQESNANVLKALDAIMKNTALPESQKIRLSETFGQRAKERVSDKVQDMLFGSTGFLSKAVKTSASNLTNGLKTGGTLDSIADFIEGASNGQQSLNGLDTSTLSMLLGGAFSSATGAATEWASNTKLGSKVKNRFFNGDDGSGEPRVGGRRHKLTNKAAFFLNNLESMTTSGLSGMSSDKVEQWFNDNLPGFLGEKRGELGDRLFDKLVRNPLMTSRSSYKRIDYAGNANLHEPANFDVRTSRSINEVIPELLSRILRETTVISTGNKNVPRLTYDFASSSFKTTDEMKDKVISKIRLDEKGRKQQDREVNILIKKMDPNSNLSEETKRKFADILAIQAINGIVDSKFLMDPSNYASLGPDASNVFNMVKKYMSNDDDFRKEYEINASSIKLKGLYADPIKWMKQMVESNQTDILKELNLLTDSSDGKYGTLNIDQIVKIINGEDVLGLGYRPGVGTHLTNGNKNPGKGDPCCDEQIAIAKAMLSIKKYNTVQFKDMISHLEVMSSVTARQFAKMASPQEVGQLEQLLSGSRRKRNSETGKVFKDTILIGPTGKPALESKALGIIDATENRKLLQLENKSKNNKQPTTDADIKNMTIAQLMNGTQLASFSTNRNDDGDIIDLGSDQYRDVSNETNLATTAVDIYVSSEKYPRLTRAGMQNGQYRNRTGSVIKKIGDIKEDVYDRAGNLVLSIQDFSEAHIRKKDKVEKLKEKLPGIFGKLVGSKDAIMEAWNSRGGIYGAMWKLGKVTGVKALGQIQDFRTYAGDVFDGESPVPLLTKGGFERGEYISKKTGKLIRSLKDVDSDVLDRDGNTVVSFSKFRKGVFGANGKRIGGFLQRVWNLQHNLIVKTALLPVRAYIGAYKWAFKRTWKNAKFVFEKGKSLVGKITNTETGLQAVTATNEQTNNILVSLGDLIDARFPEQKKILGDRDGDGVRDNSVADLRRRRQALLDARNVNRDEKSGGKGKGWGIPFLGKKKDKEEDEDEDDEDGSLLSDLADLADIGDFVADRRDGRRRRRPRIPGRGLKGKLGKLGQFFGKGGSKAALARGATTAGAAGLGATALGAAAPGAATAATSGLASAAAPAAAGATSVAARAAPGLLGRLGGMIPGAGLAVGGGMTAYQLAQGDYMGAAITGGTTLASQLAFGGGLAGLGSAASGLVGGASALGSGALAAGTFLVSNPIGWAILGTAAVAAIGYGAYKWWKNNKPNEYTKLRLAQYGFNPEGEYAKKVMGFERMILDASDANGAVDLSKIKPEELLELFDMTKEDLEAHQKFQMWYEKRFLPVFQSWRKCMAAISKENDLQAISVDAGEGKRIIESVKIPPEVYGVAVSPFKTLDKLEMMGSDVTSYFDKTLKEVSQGVNADGTSKSTMWDYAKDAAKGMLGGGPLMMAKNLYDRTQKDKQDATNNAASSKMRASASNMLAAGMVTTTTAPDGKVVSTIDPKKLDALSAIRFKTYGLAVMDPDKVYALAQLESIMMGYIVVQGKDVKFKAPMAELMPKVISLFSIDPNDTTRQAYLKEYLEVRFMPTLEAFVKATAEFVPSGNYLSAAPKLPYDQQVTIAKATRDAKSNKGGLIRLVWTYTLSPWRGYTLNTEVSSTEENFRFLNSKGNVKPSAQEGNAKDANKPTEVDKQETSWAANAINAAKNMANSIMNVHNNIYDGAKNFIASQWQNTKDTVKSIVTGEKSVTEGISDWWDNTKANAFDSMVKVTGGTKKMILSVYSALRKAGFTDAQSRYMLAEVGRENSFRESVIFGYHHDPKPLANGQPRVNIGMFSWNDSRGARLYGMLKQKGLISGNTMSRSQAALDTQAEFIMLEMKTTESRSGGPFLSRPNITDAEAQDILGRKYIRWAIDNPKYRAGGLKNRAHWLAQVNAALKDAPAELVGSGSGNMGDVGSMGAAVANSALGKTPPVSSKGASLAAAANETSATSGGGSSPVMDGAMAGMTAAVNAGAVAKNAVADSSGGVAAAGGGNVPANTKPGKAAALASRGAKGKSIGLCAKYVRTALQGAGYKFTPNPSAYQYATKGTLAKAGFKQIDNNTPHQTGDVVVFSNSKAHPHGHIQIFDGKRWVSDFVQKGFSPYRTMLPWTKWRDASFLNGGVESSVTAQVAGDIQSGVDGVGGAGGVVAGASAAAPARPAMSAEEAKARGDQLRRDSENVRAKALREAGVNLPWLKEQAEQSNKEAKDAKPDTDAKNKDSIIKRPVDPITGRTLSSDSPNRSATSKEQQGLRVNNKTMFNLFGRRLLGLSAVDKEGIIKLAESTGKPIEELQKLKPDELFKEMKAAVGSGSVKEEVLAKVSGIPAGSEKETLMKEANRKNIAAVEKDIKAQAKSAEQAKVEKEALAKKQASDQLAKEKARELSAQKTAEYHKKIQDEEKAKSANTMEALVMHNKDQVDLLKSILKVISNGKKTVDTSASASPIKEEVVASSTAATKPRYEQPTRAEGLVTVKQTNF